MNDYHKSVLLREAIDGLRIKKGGKYIDATLGGGGHSFGIANKGGEIIGIDLDSEALEYVEENLKSQISNVKYQGNLKLVRGNFRDVDKISKENEFESVDGILFDLGVSSHQLDEAERGFSYSKDANLDMRMDKNLSVTASDLVNGLNKGELYELFSKMGEEPFARPISTSIIKSREIKRIETTKELADIVVRSYPKGFHKIHPATKVFQALRILVNDELNNLKETLPKAVQILGKKGRLVVITFHSLEDRITKELFNDFEKQGLGIIITKKPIIPSEEEIYANQRARSSKLRIFEKI